MKRRLAWGALALLVLSGAVVAVVGWQRAAVRDAVYEAVVLHVAHNHYPDAVGKGTFFVEVEGQDPSDRLLQRLNSSELTVKPWSEGVRTQSKGVWIPVWGFKRTGPDSAEVDWSYRFGPMDAAGFTCTVVREDGEWVVREEQMGWIS
jgi:hypothetical protein